MKQGTGMNTQKLMKRNIFDLLAQDNNKRNILHRACLAQNLMQIKNIC